MTVPTPADSLPVPASRGPLARWGVAPFVALAVLFALASMATRFAQVWNTGGFFDTDDAMRMVQVRDFLSGQNWFDLSAHRMNAPDGLPMHWSRTLDAPLALLLWFFGLFLSPETAERVTRLVFPGLMLIGLFLGSLALARVVFGKARNALALIAVTLSGVIFWQFLPGRIDHHAPQIVVLLYMAAFFLDGLDGAKNRAAFYGALLVALSLSISIENLPFIIVCLALLPVAALLQPAIYAKHLKTLGLGLGLGLALAFVGTVSPSAYFVTQCDAFGAPHFFAGVLGAAGLIGLGFVLPKIPPFPVCALVIVACGALPLGLIAALYPACLHDPLRDLDPVLRVFWLSHVSEALPLSANFAKNPADSFSMVGPFLIGLGCAFLAARDSQGVARGRWFALATLLIMGFLAAFWQVRVFSSLAPLVALCALWGVVRLTEIGAKRSATLGGPLAMLCLFLAFSSTGWAMLLDASPKSILAAPVKPGEKPAPSCLSPQAFEPFKTLPAGLIVSQIDPGSYFLVHTHHSVLAGAYHRNNRGNRLALDILTGDMAKSEKLLRQSGARYVALCVSAESDLKHMQDMAPDGLAAWIGSGKTPDWLKPLDLGHSNYRAFELR